MIVENGTLKNSFALKSTASFVAKIESEKDLLEAVFLSKKIGLPILPLGDGTNMIPGPYVEAIVAEFETRGIELKETRLRVAAGETWDDIVTFAVQKNLSGIEALSLIPGKTGAAPIQNIGAYGREIKDVIDHIKVFDTKKEEFVIFNNKDCKFGYRDSLFKKEKGRFIVTEVSLLLLKNSPKIPNYKDVKNYFEKKENSSPSLKEIREAVIEIRKNKLPDPKIVPNCGSFFKNPIVSKQQAEKIKNMAPSVPIFEQNGLFKIPAGFLIDSLGFKGKKIGNIEIYKNNALVLTNPYGASFKDLLFAKSEIENAVFQKFGIKLEPEVNILE